MYEWQRKIISLDSGKQWRGVAATHWRIGGWVIILNKDKKDKQQIEIS